MSLKDIVRNALTHPLARGLDLNAPEATAVHARLIKEKGFLRLLYKSHYRDFVAAHESAPQGLRLEIGSGGGFLGELIPSLATMDLRPGADVNLKASALALPLADGKAGCLFLMNVLHHLPAPEAFFSEAERVLAPGGRLVMIEPFVSPVSRILYRGLHHEPLNPEREGWTLDGHGPMSSSDMAIPWVIFVRDRGRFESLFPGLEILRVTPHTILLYALSGGVSMRSFLPAAAFEPLRRAEELLGGLSRHLASMMTVEIARR
ncbi:MAG: class I SAM-dependent methyltransferase [Deltaproteobacteria bacterium]|nr:class I SAM-dependent methyltransferase [Deltaproteobacteria bacterium]